MIKKGLCYVIASLCFGYVQAQKASLAIKITDEQHLNLPGATVFMDNNKLAAVSDNTGTATFYNVQKGSHLVTIKYIGYKDHTSNIAVEKEVVALTVTLTSGVQELKEVVVLGDRLKGQAKALNQQKNSDN